jgi:hypothetical protein
MPTINGILGHAYNVVSDGKYILSPKPKNINNTFDYIRMYGEPFMQTSMNFSSTNNDAVFKGFVDLNDYDIVIWMLLDESTADETFNSIEQSLVAEYLTNGGNLFLQNRGSHLDKPFTGQWKKLPDWLHVKSDLLFDMLDDRLILFGEWCYARHSVSYSKLPGWFLGFDVLEKKTRDFWPVKKRNNLLKQAGIPSVPLLATGHFSFPELEELLACSKLSSEPAEGIYLRYERDGRLVSRAKLVRPEFIQAVNEHWSKSIIRPNTLVSGDWI